jgi:hypothetical protein
MQSHITWITFHRLILVFYFLVLAKGGSNLETTTAVLARKPQVQSIDAYTKPYLATSIWHMQMQCMGLGLKLKLIKAL